MRTIPFLLAVAALPLLAAAGEVPELNPDNFDTLVGQSKGAFIKFYAPWKVVRAVVVVRATCVYRSILFPSICCAIGRVYAHEQ